MFKITTQSVSSVTNREFQTRVEFEDDLTIKQIVNNLIDRTESHEIYQIPEAVTVITHNGTSADITVITKI